MQQIVRRTDYRQDNVQLSRFSFFLRNELEREEAFAGFQAQIGSFDPHGAMALIFRSDWGREMTPVWKEAAGTVLAVTSGRACKGFAPWVFVREASGEWHFIALQTFGCWRLELTGAGEVLFAYDAPMLSGSLLPGEEMDVGGALAASAPDFHAVCAGVCCDLRRTLPETRMDPSIVSWNHWWRYEDAEVTEDIVLRNACLAKEMGVNLIVLDAGWFGNPQKEVDWTKLRGDWRCVNEARFPHGLAWLARQIHGMGMKFGLWLEPEGLGEKSDLRRMHPEWEAARPEGLPQPYLCLGATGAKAWLMNEISRLVDLTQADYLKFDFNVDPGFGCCRHDHGHQSGMGLWAHMRQYTAMLDELREKYPKLIIENCSSGGMRLDLTMLVHTDVSFLSDPDESDHSLQVFLWQCFLPPERLLHWAWSQTRTYEDGGHVFLPLAHEKLNRHVSAAMLHPFGLSRDLTSMTPAQRDEIARQILRYRQGIAPLLKNGIIHLETMPPLRRNRADDGRAIEHTDGPCTCVLNSEEGAVRLVYAGAGASVQEICPESSGRRMKCEFTDQP